MTHEEFLDRLRDSTCTESALAHIADSAKAKYVILPIPTPRDGYLGSVVVFLEDGFLEIPYDCVMGSDDGFEQLDIDSAEFYSPSRDLVAFKEATIEILERVKSISENMVELSRELVRISSPAQRKGAEDGHHEKVRSQGGEGLP